MRVAICLLAVCVDRTLAWWCTGHMVVATAAEMDLAGRSPEALTATQSCLDGIPQSLLHNIGSTLAENSCWADDEYTTNGLAAMFNWHFLDQPYNPQGIMNIVQFAPGNVLWAAQQSISTLQSPGASSAPLETGLMLRYLIHLLGDMHQPLHVSCMFSSQYPAGDQGGNLIPIEFDENIVELHALWDAALGNLETDYSRPLNSSSTATIQDWAQQLMTEFPREALAADLAVTNMSQWVTTNFHLAVDYVYPGIVPGQRPSADYLSTGWDIVRKQLVLAAYRLSDILAAIYSPEGTQFSI